MDMPDKIWANAVGWYRKTEEPSKYCDTEYLLSTPERELASELVEVLRKWVELADRTLNDHITRLDANRAADFSQGVREARAVLAKLDKGE